MKLIEIFKSGKHVDSNGVPREFTEADISHIVDTYADNTAPLYIHHDESGPVEGIVNKVFKFGQSVLAAVSPSPEFKDGLATGGLGGLSVRLNPSGDSWSLRHLAAVEKSAVDMLPPEFSQSEGLTIEFQSTAMSAVEFVARDTANILQGVRDLLIEQFGTEKVNNILPLYMLESLKEVPSFFREETETAFSTPEETMGDDLDKTKEGTKEVDFAAREAALEAREARVLKAARIVDMREFSDFCSAKLNEGKQFDKTSAVALFMALPEEGDAVEFGEGDNKQSLTQRALFRSFLESLPKVVEFGEVAKPDGTEAKGSLTQEELNKMADDFVEERKAKGEEVSFGQALRHVLEQGAA